VVPADVHLWCDVKTAVSEGNPYREILHYAEKNEINLISVGALTHSAAAAAIGFELQG